MGEVNDIRLICEKCGKEPAVKYGFPDGRVIYLCDDCGNKGRLKNGKR